MPTKTATAAPSAGAPRAAAAPADPLASSALADSLSGVHSHFGGDASGLGAEAFATGKDVKVGPAPEKHLAHEAGHVVQQRSGRAPTAG